MTPSRKKLQSAVVVSHVFATGPAHELVDYLRTRTRTLEFIRHPFEYVNDNRSSREVFRDGQVLSHRKTRSWRLPGVLHFGKDLIYTVIWVLEQRCQFELYVGADPLNCLAGLLLKRLGRVKTVVFYTIDYIPRRFQNPVLNHLYRALDTFCLFKADITWNLSPRISEARKKHLGPRKTSGHEITVPIGVWLDRVKPLPLDQVARRSLAFIGHLRKGQGAEMMIHTMSRIIEKVPDANLVIIGTGPLEDELKRLVKNLKLESQVVFKGFVQSHERAEELLTMCAVGLALYEPGRDNFTFYTDPGKPKLYLACGLPVIITDVPWIASVVASRELGVVVPFKLEEIACAAIRLITDTAFYDKCRRNALDYASQFDWNQIFHSALFSVM